MFKSFYTGLPEEKRGEFAEAAGTTTGYIEAHLIAPAHRRKVPNKPLMERLSAACGQFGAPFNKAQLVAYFYETPPEESGQAAA